MTISLVTGGAGFIGSHLVEALLARGDSVRVLDNFSSGNRENIQKSIDQIELFEGDLKDDKLLDEALMGVDLVFHQAAFVSVPRSLENPHACLDTNLLGTRRLLETSRRLGIRRVVLASSAAVYGENPALPLGEDARVDPLSPYAASKYITEILADLFSQRLDLEVVALRYFNVYGPRQNPDSEYAAVIPIFIKTLSSGHQPILYGDGGQTRDFIFISDIVRANLMAADAPGLSGSVLNICSGKETSLLDLLNILSDIYQCEIEPEYQEPRAGDIYRSLGDPSRARERMDFQTRVQLLEGLTTTVDWMERTQHG